MKSLNRLLLVIIFGAVAGLVSRAQPIGGQYIAVLKQAPENPANAAQEVANQHGVNVGYVYQHSIRGFSFTGNEQAAQALAKNPKVAYVEADQVCQAWEIPNGVRRIGIDEALLDAIRPPGKAVAARIAILDTGIDPNHPDLNVASDGIRFFMRPNNRVGSDANFVDDNGHGTHVAGIAAADGGVVGAAPGASLTAVKVLDANGSGTWSVVIAGIDWVAANASNFDVANMSLGGGYSAAVNDAVKRASQLGVVFTVSAGNSGRDAKDFSPASTPEAITVSAVADFDGKAGGLAESTYRSSCSAVPIPDDAMPCWSNFGSLVDMSAPGVLIKSTHLNSGYALMSGTSMAAPHVAGAAALYIAANRPTLSGLPVSQKVAHVAQALTSSGWRFRDYGHFDGGEADGLAEPLLNVPSLLGITSRPEITVSINAPVTDSAFALGEAITFHASAATSDMSLPMFWVWTSNIDGPIETAESFSTATLSEGVHTIVASLNQDGSWFSGAASITITVGTPPPPPAPKQLVLAVWTDKAMYSVGEVVQTFYRVTDAADGSPVAGATIEGTLTDAKGVQYRLRAVTDADGRVAANFQTSRQTGRGTYHLSGRATKAGDIEAATSTSFEVR